MGALCIVLVLAPPVALGASAFWRALIANGPATPFAAAVSVGLLAAGVSWARAPLDGPSWADVGVAAGVALVVAVVDAIRIAARRSGP